MSPLSDFNFSVVYRPGLKNVDADIMSRYPHSEVDKDRVSIDRETITVICNSSLFSVPVVETLPSCYVNIVDCTDAPGHAMAQVELRQLRKSQRYDPVIGVRLRAAIYKRFPHNTSI